MNNERGSTQIVIIVFVVLTLVMSGLAYTLFSAKERLEANLAKTRGDLEKKDEEVRKIEGQRIDLQAKLDDVYKDLNDVKTLHADAERYNVEFRSERDEALKASEEAQALLDEERSKLKNEISEIEQQLTEKRTEMEKLEEDIASKEEALEERIATIRAEAAEEVKNAKALVSSTQMELNQLRSRLSYLNRTKQKEFQGPAADGSVIFADPNNKFVILDLSANDGVVTDMPFDIYELGTDKKTIKKGQLRIKQVHKDVSYAVVEEIIDPLKPVIPGDLVGNPIFTRNQDKKKSFVLDGEFTQYNTTEIATLIKNFGGIVMDEVDVTTDFIVVGTNPTMLKKANRFQVPLMKEAQLYRYIQKKSADN